MKPTNEMKKAEALAQIAAYKKVFEDYNKSDNSGSIFSTVRALAGQKTPEQKKMLVVSQIEKLKQMEEKIGNVEITDTYLEELQTFVLEAAQAISPNNLAKSMGEAINKAKQDYSQKIESSKPNLGARLVGDLPKTTATAAPVLSSAPTRPKVNNNEVTQGIVKGLDTNQFIGQLVSQLAGLKQGKTDGSINMTKDLVAKIDALIEQAKVLRTIQPEEIVIKLEAIKKDIESSTELKSIAENRAPKDRRGEKHDVMDQIDQQIAKYEKPNTKPNVM
jgi:hypothetical protein